MIAKNLHYKKLENSGKDKNAQTDEDDKLFKQRLASMNAMMRRIDLSSSVLAPLIAGLIMSFFNLSSKFSGILVSALLFAVWNLVSFVFEYTLLVKVYNAVPELTKSEVDITIKIKQSKGFLKLLNPFKKIYDGWSLYIRQGLILLPSIAFSLLFLTVLSFDSITVGYAKSQRVTETFISILQGIGSLAGILGTVAFPLLHNRFKISLPYLGIVGSVYQFAFLVVCAVAIWLPGSPFTLADKYFSTNINTCIVNETLSLINNTIAETHSNLTIPLSNFENIFFETPCRVYISILILLIGMALSRFGLWLTDLTINQIIQENVGEKERGTIGGVQNSLNRFFDLIKYICVLFLSDVTQYGYLVIISATAIFSAICFIVLFVVLYTIKNKYEQVPVNEETSSSGATAINAGGIRKSMIQIYKADNNKMIEMDNLEEGENDENDSFDEGVQEKMK